MKTCHARYQSEDCEDFSSLLDWFPIMFFFKRIQETKLFISGTLLMALLGRKETSHVGWTLFKAATPRQGASLCSGFTFEAEETPPQIDVIAEKGKETA